MAGGPQTYHPALPGRTGPSSGRAREDGTDSATLWGSRCATRGYWLAAPAIQARRAPPYCGCSTRGTRSRHICGGVGKGTCAALEGGLQGHPRQRRREIGCCLHQRLPSGRGRQPTAPVPLRILGRELLPTAPTPELTRTSLSVEFAARCERCSHDTAADRCEKTSVPIQHPD